MEELEKSLSELKAAAVMNENASNALFTSYIAKNN